MDCLMPVRLAAALVAAAFFISMPCQAQDRPFVHSANWGGTGLLETPNARVLPDGWLRLGYAGAPPYNWYALGLGVLPRVEFSMRYTEINDLPSGLGPDFGDYKDKAFDVKIQLIEESRSWPAVAVGWQDFYGTRLFESQYLAVSRQIYPLDFTIGLGTKRLKGSHGLFSDRVGLFGGIEWAVNSRLTAVVEYNPIDYRDDPEPVRIKDADAHSPINAGFRFQITRGISMGVSYQRGDTLAAMCHLAFPMGKPLVPKRPDPASWTFLIRDSSVPPSARKMVHGAMAAIRDTGKFSNIAVFVQNHHFVAVVENRFYLSHARAAGRVFRILLDHMPADIDLLVVRFSRRGVPLLNVAVAPDHLKAYLLGDMRSDIFKELIQVTPAGGRGALSDADALAVQETRHLLDYGIKPQVETFFNDPSGALKSRISLDPFATVSAWKGNALAGRLSIPLYSDIGSINVPPPEAVRSDAWRYAGSSTNLEYLLSDQVVKLGDRSYGRLSMGYLERMYAGVSSEWLTFFGNGRFAAGIGIDWVRKREPGRLFDLQDVDGYTALGNFYYYYSPLNVTVQTQAGRFLAGDTGLRFQVSRRYDTGAEAGFWYSLTDTSDLTGFNNGYHDKGIFVKIPMGMFFDYQTRTQLEYRMTPWTRDVGATVFHWQDLFEFGGDLTPARFLDEMEMFDK